MNGSTGVRIPGNLNLTFPAATAIDLMARVPDLCIAILKNPRGLR